MCTCISPCLYVNLTLHVFSTPLCIVTWKNGFLCVALCVCVLQSSHTLVRVCICTCTCIYVEMNHNVTSKSLCIVWWKHGCPVWHSVCFPSHLISVPLPCLECVHCITTCIYVHPTPHVSSTPYTLLHGNLDFPVWQCVCVCVPVTLPLVPHLD